MINRAAIILRYKTPAVEWINDADPVDGHPPISVEDVNVERTVYLIDDRAADDDAALQEWVRRNFRDLFESELEGWYTGPALWPKALSLKLFHEWFDLECHTVLIDTVGTEIREEDDV